MCGWLLELENVGQAVALAAGGEADGLQESANRGARNAKQACRFGFGDELGGGVGHLRAARLASRLRMSSTATAITRLAGTGIPLVVCWFFTQSHNSAGRLIDTLAKVFCLLIGATCN